MFDDDSRYARLPIKTFTDAEGREHAHVARRIIPQDQEIAGTTRVQEGDRLDLIAGRAYGDPRAFWRIADANPDPEPEALADRPGRRLRLALVKPEQG
ncbi:MAG: hypothetical protein ACQEUZ_02175 [Pseudomonadota bacterium]